MTKQEARKVLLDRSINADVENGILWLYGISMRSAKKLLREIGYDATFGVRAEKVKEGVNSE